MNRSGLIVGAAACAVFAAAHARAQYWTHFAGGPERVSATSDEVSITVPRWIAASDEAGRPISYYGQSGVVARGERVYARGMSGGVSRLYAFERATGAVAWSAPVPAPVLESWAAPTVDVPHGTVLVGDGMALSAFDMTTGAPKWLAPMPRPVVSNSPLATPNFIAPRRAYVVDYDGFGISGSLHCINTDPFEPTMNPFQPGEQLWSEPLGRTAGATATMNLGFVYIATVADKQGAGSGRVLAFNPGSAGAELLWATSNPEPHGFYGGVSGTIVGVYAASYSFSGGLDSANLVKLDPQTGEVRWSVACNRTAAIPVPIPSSTRVAVSGGIRGFGTVPSVAIFRDDGTSATRLWDTALDSWHDDNQNGQLDPGEYLLVGGWTQQPVMTASGLLVGALPAGASTTVAVNDLYLLDITQHPSSPAFVKQHFVGAGASPAVAGGWVFTVGPSGLHAFGPPCKPDCNADGGLNLADFGCFQTRFALGDPYADCNGDGVRNLADFGCFQTSFALGCE